MSFIPFSIKVFIISVGCFQSLDHSRYAPGYSVFYKVPDVLLASSFIHSCMSAIGVVGGIRGTYSLPCLLHTSVVGFTGRLVVGVDYCGNIDV